MMRATTLLALLLCAGCVENRVNVMNASPDAESIEASERTNAPAGPEVKVPDPRGR